MIVALLFAAAIAISLGWYLKLASNAVTLANRSFYFNAAQDLADAGLEHALWSLNNAKAYTYPSNFTTGGFSSWVSHNNQYRATFPATGSYYALSGGARGQVKVYVNSDSDISINSNAAVDWPGIYPYRYAVVKGIITLSDGSTISKTAIAFVQQRSLSGGGMISRRGIDFNGNVVVDSWISHSDDSNPSNDVAYNNHAGANYNQRANATIASPALVTLQNADVYGKASIGTDDPSGITVGANGRLRSTIPGATGIDSSLLTFDFSASFPDAPIATGSAIAAVTGSVNLTTGSYSTSSVNLSGGGASIVIGTAGATPTYANVSLVVSGDVALSGNSKIVVNPGSTLTLYVGGDFTMTGTSGIENGGPDPGGGSDAYANMNMPKSFTAYGTRTAAQIDSGSSMQTWSIKGTSYLSTVIFAPNANISVNGTGDTLGSIVGNTVHMVGSGNFHQDESLSNIRNSGVWELVKWRELTTQAERDAYTAEMNF